MQLGPGYHRPVSARQAFPPVYFAMVMATGIVSIAVYLNGMQRLAATLMWLNVVLFIAFWILLIGRLALAPRRLLEELTSFKLAPGFFTIVAGTSVLARQLLIIQAHIPSGAAEKNRRLVADELAAAAGENRRTPNQARPLLLAATGGESPHAAAVWEHAAQDRGAAITNRIDEP
jgi:hypothetical protein